MPIWCLLKKVDSTRTFAPLLSLLLLCQSSTWHSKHPPAYGYFLDVATVPAPQPLAPIHMLCGDSRYIVAIAARNGRVRLNAEADVSLDHLVLRLREILRYRAEKLVYVKGEPDASWADFVGMVDRVGPEADVVSIITPEVDRLAHQRFCLAPSCGRCENFRSFRPALN